MAPRSPLAVVRPRLRSRRGDSTFKYLQSITRATKPGPWVEERPAMDQRPETKSTLSIQSWRYRIASDRSEPAYSYSAHAVPAAPGRRVPEMARVSGVIRLDSKPSRRRGDRSGSRDEPRNGGPASQRILGSGGRFRPQTSLDGATHDGVVVGRYRVALRDLEGYRAPPLLIPRRSMRGTRPGARVPSPASPPRFADTQSSTVRSRDDRPRSPRVGPRDGLPGKRGSSVHQLRLKRTRRADEGGTPTVPGWTSRLDPAYGQCAK